VANEPKYVPDPSGNYFALNGVFTRVQLIEILSAPVHPTEENYEQAKAKLEQFLERGILMDAPAIVNATIN
jgi:hypothetical protein